MKSLRYLVQVGVLFGLAACGQMDSSSSLSTPEVTRAEALSDFAALEAKVRSLYGPLEYKQQLLGFKYTDLVKTTKADISAAKTEQARLGAISRFLMTFRDGHVGIRFPLNSTGVNSYKIGAFLIPIENRAIVAKVEPSLSERGIKVGDELIEIDGKKPFDLLPSILKYAALGNEVSDQHAIYRVLNRRFYMDEIVPTNPEAKLVFKKADKTEVTINVAWEKVKEDTSKFDLVGGLDQFMVGDAPEMMAESEGSIMEMGSYTPFFASEAVKQKFNLVRVHPSDEYLKKHGVEREQLKDSKGEAIYAALFRYPAKDGKTYLLIRQPGYSPRELKAGDLVKGYRAILDQYDGLVSGLVVDQTHTPGGSLMYAHDFFALFVNKPAVNLVQHINTDREWVKGLHDWAGELEKTMPGLSKAMRVRAQLVDKAMDEGKTITEPMPLVGFEYVQPDEKYTWKLPVMVMADELAGSCGDIFPMYMKRNGIAKVFGQRTMGLGGNVEQVIALPFSGATVRLTRGLFTTYSPNNTYLGEELVENHGITPDYLHSLTVEDARGGFVGYFEAMAKKAASMK